MVKVIHVKLFLLFMVLLAKANNAHNIEVFSKETGKGLFSKTRSGSLSRNHSSEHQNSTVSLSKNRIVPDISFSSSLNGTNGRKLGNFKSRYNRESKKEDTRSTSQKSVNTKKALISSVNTPIPVKKPNIFAPAEMLPKSTLQINGFISDKISTENFFKSQIESNKQFFNLIFTSAVITDRIIKLINQKGVKKMTFDDCCFDSNLIRELDVSKLDEFHLINTREDASAVIDVIIPRLNPKLVHLNLSGNVLQESSQGKISTFLMKASALTTINLSNTGLSSKSSILPSLFRSKTIQNLNLSKNNVGSTVLLTLRIQHNLQWRTLDISHNPIRYEDKMFANIDSVEFLDISYCFLDHDVSRHLMKREKLHFVNYTGNCVESTKFKKSILKSYPVFHLELSMAKELSLPKDESKLTDFRKLSSVYVPFSNFAIICDQSKVKSARFSCIDSDTNFKKFTKFISSSKNLDEIHIEEWTIDLVYIPNTIVEYSTIRSLIIDVLVSKSSVKYREFLQFLFVSFPNVNRLGLGSSMTSYPLDFSSVSLPPISHLILKNFILAETATNNIFLFLTNLKQLNSLHLANVYFSYSSLSEYKLPIRSLIVEYSDEFLPEALFNMICTMPYVSFLIVKNAPNDLEHLQEFLKRFKNLRSKNIEYRNL